MKLMGILNATPDSFFPDSRIDAVSGVRKGLELIGQGADLLDVGGESTRPGAAYVKADEEIRRVVPVLRGLREAGVQVPLSIDTRKSETARAAFAAGAEWLNDVSALSDDPGLGPFAAESGMMVVLMHRQGHPDAMQKAPSYREVVADVSEYLERRIEFALACGIATEKIIVDPGIGFGKTLENTLELVQAIPRFKTLGFPLLIGLSRKSFLGKLTGAEVDDRLPGSLAAALASAALGADYLRVHDVAETHQALAVWNALIPGSRP